MNVCCHPHLHLLWQRSAAGHQLNLELYENYKNQRKTGTFLIPCADLFSAFDAARIWVRSRLAYLELPMTPRLGLETR